MEDIIYNMLVEGYNANEIGNEYGKALLAADKRYGEYLRERERLAKLEEERREKLEYEKRRRAEARQALGAAMVEYMEAHDMEVTERDLRAIDEILSDVFDSCNNRKIVKVRF